MDLTAHQRTQRDVTITSTWFVLLPTTSMRTVRAGREWWPALSELLYLHCDISATTDDGNTTLPSMISEVTSYKMRG